MAKVNDDGSVTVTLQFMIKVEGDERTELTLKRVKGKQVRRVDLSRLADGAVLLPIIADLAGITPSEADQLDGVDIMELSKVVGSFFGLSPATGAGSTPISAR